MAKKKSSTGKPVPTPKRPEVKVKKPAKKVKPEVLTSIYYPDKEVSLAEYVAQYFLSDPYDERGAIEETRYELSKLQDGYIRLLAVLQDKHIINVADIKKIVGGI